MTERADQVIAALRSGHDRLSPLVRKASADDLSRATGSSEWDLSQVLSHLGSGAEISLATLTGVLDGTGAPAGDFNTSVWARWDAMSRAERAEGFLVASEALITALEKLTPQQRADLSIVLGFLPAPVDVAGFGAMRLSEFTLHAWDIDVAFDPKATLAPEAVPLLFDTAAMLTAFAAKPGALDGRTGRIAVRLTAPDRTFGLHLGEKVEITDAAPADPDGEITAPAEYWLRLLTGRHAPEHTPSDVGVSGAFTLDDLRRVFPGF